MTTIGEWSTALGDGAIANIQNQHTNEAAFREAIESCDVEMLEAILSGDKTLWDTRFEYKLWEKNVETVLQIPPLTFMTAKKNSSIVQLLLKHGAPVNTESQTTGGTALHMAARNGAFDIAKMLINNNASVNQKDSSGSTPLHLASLHACVHFVDLLLDHGADLKFTDNRGCTPFHRAAGRGRLQILESLWARGPKTQIFDRNIFSNQPLHMAAFNDRPEVIPWLMKNGASALELTQRRMNAFHEACAAGKAKAAKAILANMEDNIIHVANGFQMTPLLLACRNLKLEVVDMLLQKGASTTDTDAELYTCYHHVILHQETFSSTHNDILNQLHGAGADINQCNQQGHSPLVFACLLNKPDFIQPLLNLGADINQKRTTTALMEASILLSSTAVKILLGANPDTTLRNRHGLTALALTCRGGRVENLRELIKANADVTVRTRQGHTPLFIAANYGHIEAALELLQTNEYYNPKSPLLTEAPTEKDASLCIIEKALLSGFDTMEKAMLSSLSYVMFWAVRTGRIDLTMKCIARNMEILGVQSQSFNWLHVAANYGHANIIECLAPFFDISHKTKHGVTALHLAATGGFHVACQTLLMLAHRQERNGLARVDAILEPDSSGDSPLSLCFKRRSAEHRAIAEGFWNILGSLGTDQIQLLRSNQEKAPWILETLARYEKPGREKVLAHFLEQWNPALLHPLGLPSPPPQTALEWAVFHREVVVVWWLLSKGGYASPHVRTKAMRIIDLPNSATETMISDLLQSPPPLLERIDNPNDDCPPALPDSSDCDPSDLETDVNIVDIYSQGKGLKALHVKGSIRKTIYEETGGPNVVMRDNPHSLDLRDLATLKASLGKGQAHVLSLDSGGPGAQHDLEVPSDNLKFRWIHLPMNKFHLMRDLVTRLSHDSNRSEMDHNILMEHLNGTWTELPAGGGKFYMKPRCERATTRHSDQKKESPRKEEAIHTRPTTIYVPYLTTGKKPENPSRNLKSNRDNRMDDRIHDRINTRNWERVTHTPITLDQYYYPVLDDTSRRDNDQVLSRYLIEKKAQISDRILMIGHLWMWIIDESKKKSLRSSLGAHIADGVFYPETIITAADEMGMFGIMNPVGFFQTVLSSISNGQAGTRFSMPTTVHSMMELMLGIATNFFMAECVSVGDSAMSPIDVFRQSIKNVVNHETNLFRKFIEDLKKERSDTSQPKTWLKRLFTVYQIPANPDRAISREAELLDEMRDIRDELCMLKALAEHQEVVWKQAFETEELRGCFKYYHPYTPTDIKQDLEGMVVEADIETNSINTLLDLRTKQASIKDAEYSRIQANDDARQSKSVFIFTIVTVIFLPLSFLSSLFALDITSFPHESGDVKYKPGWIFPILFGATAVVCIPILIFVWNVNTLSRQTRRIDKTATDSESELIRSKGAIRSSFYRRSAERSTTGSESV